MKLTAIRQKLFEIACLPGVEAYFNDGQIWVRGGIPNELYGESVNRWREQRTDSLYNVLGRSVLGLPQFSCYQLADTVGDHNEYCTYLALCEPPRAMRRNREGQRARWLRRLILRDLGLTEPNPNGKMD